MEYSLASNLCTQEQITNLQKLLDFVKSGNAKTDFDMKTYACSQPKKDDVVLFENLNLGLYEVKNECGTVCCLAGHGPLAGVEVSYCEDWNWKDYVERVFTNGSRGVYAFLFSPYWADYQPSKEEAIFRLELFLKKGLPVSFRDSLSHGYNYELFTRECVLKLHSFE